MDVAPEIIATWQANRPPAGGLLHYPDKVTCQVPIDIDPVLILSGIVNWAPEHKAYCFCLQTVTTYTMSTPHEEISVSRAVHQALCRYLVDELKITLLFGVYPVGEDIMFCNVHSKMQTLKQRLPQSSPA